MKFLAIFMAAALSLASVSAVDAKRLGGGKSAGQQSSNVTQREASRPATPAQPNAAPGQNAAAPAAAGTAAAGAAAAAKKPWGAMLGGLAAGLGLAWLASSLGLGEEFASILMFALLAMVVMAAVAYFMRRRAMNQMQGGGQGYAMAGAGAGAAAPMPRSYRPENVGNDASARPFERNSTFGDAPGAAQGGSRIGARVGGGLAAPGAVAANDRWGVPADFDEAGFLEGAKSGFVALQAAWDKADLASLRAMMTDSLLTEVRNQLAERDNLSGKANRTEVVMLEAQLLGIEDLGQDYMASVEFSGLIREDASAGPTPFREVWNMTKPKDGSMGWLVAGLQALH
jgi:predicted lipid-binding transport protein (Tim44 family)